MGNMFPTGTLKETLFKASAIKILFPGVAGNGETFNVET